MLTGDKSDIQNWPLEFEKLRPEKEKECLIISILKLENVNFKIL
jgi:hypothetical protein